MKAEQTPHARNILPRLPQGAGSNLKSYSPTQLHFLMRLSHLQKQRRETVNVFETNDWRVRLIRWRPVRSCSARWERPGSPCL